jgi:DNA polymerase-3 subunit delta'
MEYFGSEKLNIEKAKQLKNLTDADLGKIIRLLNNEVEMTDFFESFSDWMRLTYKMNIQGISKWVDGIAATGRQHQILFISYAIKMMRECLIFNFANQSLLKTNQKEFEFIGRFSPFIHEENSILIVEKLEKTIKAIQRNANAKILFFELSLQMAKYLKLKRKFAIK